MFLRRRLSVSTRVSLLFVLVLCSAFLFPLLPNAQAPDTTPPTISTQSPPSNATGVSISISVRAVFNEPIQASTLQMELVNSGSVVQASQLNYDPATQTATLVPNTSLAGGQTFTVRVSGARDLANNQMAQVIWSFTTATPGFVDKTLPQTGLVDPTVVRFGGDGRVFVAEKSGRIYVYDNLDDATPTLFVDLRTSVHNFWDRGLLGMTLHPAFPAVPYIYVLYSFDAVLPNFPAPRWGIAGAVADGCPDPTGVGCAITGRLSRFNANEFLGTPLGTAQETVLVQDWFQQFWTHTVGNLEFGADGALYASGGDGANANYVDFGPPSSPQPNPPSGDPSAEGGALRSQDLQTSSDPVGLDGTIIRVDPDTGAALPDNPLIASADPNARRVVAYGLRNPFRFTIKPGTNELWIADVGWVDWEEINRLPNPLSSVVANFGWPCYDGPTRQPGYDAANIPICENLYTQPQLGLTSPYFVYNHASPVVAGEACPTGGSSLSGAAFYPDAGGAYPAAYNGALFFADYVRDCIWAMRVGAGGQLDPANVVTIKSNPGDPREGPVQLVTGPGGDIFYVGYDDDRLHRIVFNVGNQAPTAMVQASPIAGASPLTVNFSAAGSSDPEGQTLTYAWDLDGDGAFDDAAGQTAQFTYVSATPKAFNVRVRATDDRGLSDVASVTISLNNTPPTPTIQTPVSGFRWKVGDPIMFQGGATDQEEGVLPNSSLRWSIIMHHCPSNCHTHTVTEYVGVANGSFAAPDHEYPSFLEIRLTATDSAGLQSSTSVNVQPQTVSLQFASNPPGLTLTINGVSGTTPFSRTVIAGSTNSVSAPSPQTLGGQGYQFASWSNGGTQVQTLVAPASNATFTATYQLVASPSPLVAAYNFDAGTGTTVMDQSGRGNTLVLTDPTWTSLGHSGGALEFNGTTSRAELPSPATDLRFTTAFTMMAWVNPTTLGPDWHMIAGRQLGTSFDDSWVMGTNDTTLWFFAGGSVSATLPAGVWTHVAAVKDGPGLQLYLNGVLVASTTTATSPLVTDNNEVGIGAGSNGAPLWSEFFHGRLDDLRFYAQARTLAQIQTDMVTPVGGVPDTVPPVISNVAAAVATQSATITWTTNEGSTSHVEYGLTTAYGNTTLLDPTLVTSHTVTVAGLTPNTLYHYRVRSRDASGNERISSDAIFTTASASSSPPVAAYNFDAGTGTTVMDQSGRGNTLVLTDPTWTSLGHSGGALEFNGTTSRAELPSPATDLRFTTAFTMMAWVNPTTLGPDWHMIAGRQLGTSFDDSWVMGTNDTTLWFFAGGNVSATLPAGVWTHVAAVKDGPGLQLYLNGVLVASTTTATSPLVTDNNEVGIGAGSNGAPLWSEFFHGRLDDLRFYAQARSLAQIQTDMATPVGGAPDTVPPVISAVAASPAVQGATITWTTNEGRTSQVEYGLTTAYGSTTALDSALVTSHTVTLSGLTSNTLYHYRVRSRDASGNERISSDATFTTAGDTVPPVISAVAASPAVQGATITWTTNEGRYQSSRVWADDGVWQHNGPRLSAGHESHGDALRVDVEYAVSLSGALARCEWQRAHLRRLHLYHHRRHRAARD